MKRTFTKLMAALALLVGLCIPMGMWGQAPVGETLWAEDFSGYAANAVPSGEINNSHTGTTVYGGVTLTYACEGSGTKIYVDTQMGGSSQANLLIAKNGSFSVSGISTGGASELTVNYAKSGQGTLVISSTTDDVEISGNDSGATITTNGASTIDLVFTNTSSSKNLRFDDVEVTVKTAGGGSQTQTYTVTYVPNGGTGTMTDENSPYEEDEVVTLLTNTFTAPEGKLWDSWLVKDASNNVLTVTDNQFTMPASNVTVTAQWKNDPSAPQYEWVLADWADLTGNDIFVIVGNNLKAMANEASTSNPSAVAVTIQNGKITTDVAANMKWNRVAVDGGYKLLPNGSTTTWLNNPSSTGLRIDDATSNNVFTYVTYSSKNYLKVGDRYACIYNNGDWRAYTTSNVPSNATNTTFYKRQLVSNDPTINASNLDIAYDATSGSIAYTIDNEPDPAGTLTADIKTGTTPTIADFALGTVTSTAVPFTCSANNSGTARTAVVTLTYTYNSQTTTKDVTITQDGNPDAVDNIEDITASNTQYKVRGTVVATNSRGFVMGDGTGYVYYYKNSAPDQSVGDKITLEGTTSTYGHVLQFQGTPTIATSATSNYDGTPAATVITAVPDYTSGLHLSTYFQFEGTLSISSSNYLIAVGSETIQVSYPTDAQTAAMAALEGKNVRVKGYFSGINSSNYFTVMMESVEEVTDPYITIESDAFELTANEEESYLEITYGNFTPISFDIMYCDANGNELSDYPKWITLAIETPAGEEGDFVYYDVEPNGGAARTAYFKVYASLGEGQETVYSNLVAITQAAYENPNCTWDLSIDSYASASENQVSWTSNFATMTIDKGESTTNANNYLGGTNNRTSTRFYTSSILTLSPVSGYVITSVVFTATTSGYANALGNSTWTNATASVNETVVTVTPTDGAIAMSAKIGATCGFTQVKVYYLPAYRLTITGYTGEKDHYSLIASPVTVNPATVAGMTEGDFDLYYFDESKDKEEWRNYETANGHFNLVPGTGYLYAKKATAATSTYNFTLAGAPYSGNGQVTLHKTVGTQFSGWNLIGNPFTCTAYLVGGGDFYRMNAAGDALIINTDAQGGGDAIDVCEGIFVQCTATGTVSFTTTEPTQPEPTEGSAGNNGMVNISVAQVVNSRDAQSSADYARIRINNGQNMTKFVFNENTSRVYISQNGKDYAVVRSNAEGEIPVSFKAAQNGNYTISVEPENVEMNYLHLFDNKTGNDVDLLATPSYTFQANSSDYESRFRLVFNANAIEENDTEANTTFAYFNGSEWVINNPSTGLGDNATLQVIDMMGRVLSSQTLSGNAEVTLNQAAGIYMFRLVNGDSVKTQKVVVR